MNILHNNEIVFDAQEFSSFTIRREHYRPMGSVACIGRSAAFTLI
jgi:hypothetical protein